MGMAPLSYHYAENIHIKSCLIFLCYDFEKKNQGPVVQSIISLTSSLVVKMLTVLVSTISNSQVFLLKMWGKLLTSFQQKY